MARIIVTTDRCELPNAADVLLDEEVHPVHLSTGQAASQLVERIAWAIGDAEHAQSAIADERLATVAPPLRHPLPMDSSTGVAIGA
jgi:hypothetical protein